MTDAEALAAYVNAGSGDPFVSQCWREARALVSAYLGKYSYDSASGVLEGVSSVPSEVQDRAVLEVGAELFHRRQAPGGITQFATVDGPSPVRMARDPMLGAYPMLDRYLPGGFA